MGRNKRGTRRERDAANPLSVLEEGQNLQQQGERRKGIEAARAYEKAVAKYNEAILAGSGTGHVSNAFFGLGVCHHGWGNALIDHVTSTPNEELTLEAQETAYASAREHFHAAAEAYRQVGHHCLDLYCTLSTVPDLAELKQMENMAVSLVSAVIADQQNRV
ncbi:unnamed protein product [Ostreobium quekettii]|uniref:Uncharacterized protein n=1 Tax=Ostreobium quekettii TaxID=121088 RepID=A0A8S1JA03_9CHLO|nr:unnamed protein product [Ostreobium quekettii]